MPLAMTDAQRARRQCRWLFVALVLAPPARAASAESLTVQILRQSDRGVLARITNQDKDFITALLIKTAIRDEMGRWQRDRYRYLDVAVNFRSDQPIAPGESREFVWVPDGEFREAWQYRTEQGCAIFAGGRSVGDPAGCTILHERRRAALEELVVWEARVAELRQGTTDPTQLLALVRDRMAMWKQRRPPDPAAGAVEGIRLLVLAQLEAMLAAMDDRCTGPCREASLAALEQHWKSWRRALAGQAASAP